MSHDDELDHGSGGGSFSAGIVLGLMAGVAGMFLFGTEKGKRTVEQLKNKWEKVKPQVQEGLVETEANLKKSKRPFFQAMAEIVDYVADHLETQKPKSKSAAKSLSAQKKKQFFKK